MTSSISTTTLYARFCENLDHLGLKNLSSVLIAYSGGADSAVLLDLFCRLAKERKICVFALHLNHNIRKEASEDAALCQRVCQKYGVSLALFSEDIPAYAKAHKMGLEDAARFVRYEILENSRKENNIDCIATAHNATDNAETVLFHLTRGSALRGVSGIPEQRQTIIRPLLSFTKGEILAYAKENGIPYCEDSTNADTTYTRNYIRHEVLPHLETINPTYENAILRFSKAAREDDEALYAIANRYADVSDTQTLAALSPAILRRVLLIKYRKTAHNEISRGHLDEALEKIRLAAMGAFSGEISFPGTYRLAIDATSVRFLSGKPSPRITEPILLTPDCDLVFADRFHITVQNGDAIVSEKPLFVLIVPEDALKKLYVRSRLDGDRYRQGNMTRNVKKMLCDAKIPKEERDALPFILYDNIILFVPYLAPSDLYQTMSNTDKKTYRISIFQIKN